VAQRFARGREHQAQRERLNDMAQSPKKPNGLQQVLKPSPALAGVIGASELSRGDAVSKIWAYIKQHNLQNPQNKREIMADDKLRPVFDGKDKVSMFEMNKHLAKHLKA
jgi:chromatin remodeling complex protein RSC6